MSTYLSLLGVIALTWLITQITTRIMWKNKNPDGTDKKSWPPSPTRSVRKFTRGLPAFRTGTYAQLTQWAQECGDVFSVKLGRKRIIVLNSVDSVQKAFVHDSQINSARTLGDPVEMVMSGQGKTVFTAPFTLYWSRLRRAISYVIGKDQWARHTTVLTAAQTTRLCNLDPLVDPEHLRRITDTVAMEFVWRLCLGKKVDMETSSKMTEMVDQIQAKQASSFLQRSRFFPVLQPMYLLHAMVFGDPVVKLRNQLLDMIQEQLPSTPSYASLAQSMLSIAPSKNDPDVQQMQQGEILVNILHLVIHGRAMMSAAAFNVVQRLATMPDMQEECRKSPEMCEAFVKECLRMDPPTRLFEHTARADYNLLNNGASYRVDEGTELVCNLDAVHADPAVYPQPTVFDPRRFHTETHADHFAFGAGRRICQGKYVSEHMLTALVQELVHCYDITGGDTVTRQEQLTAFWSWTGMTKLAGAPIQLTRRAA